MDTSRLFSDHSALYAEARPHYPPRLFDYIASLCSHREGAWDCGTGNGQAARGLAPHFSRVEASDVSGEQLQEAISGSNIRYSVERAETTGYPSDHFDLVNVAQALHWFANDAFWAEVRRVLKPTGVFVAYCYSWSRVAPAVDRVVEDELLGMVEPYWQPEHGLCWSGYRDLALPLAREESPDFELENGWNAQQYIDYLRSWSAVQRGLAHLGPRFFEAFEARLKRAWGDPEQALRVTTPLSILVARPGEFTLH